MKDVLNWIINHWSLCAFLLAIFVQFTPIIKFNPFTALFQFMGKIIVRDVRADISALKIGQDELTKTIDENEKDRIRWEVLDFANSCRNNVKHTKEEYVHIIALNDKYKLLLSKTGDHNGVFDADYEYVLHLYHERLEKNDFLS